ncbi:hypothetical protein LCGC14_2342590 [marine sediment metagenome]|uniref:Uncharacterized protein n=1 Tax=marine sediment metagenome TaxID=412755 RepID=A0A0F9CBF5_9ZZZZ
MGHRKDKTLGDYPPEIEDIRRQFIRHPLHQSKIGVSASQAAGAAELAYRRGRMQGATDVYRFILKHHPRIAVKIKNEFSVYEQE